MKTWRPERAISGPRTATRDDVPALNRIFADSFTDRYRKDGLTGVRVPPLNPAVWNYAIQDAGDGALVWHDERGELVAFNIAHRSGREGWMGPLAVRMDRQGEGIGHTIVGAAIRWLTGQGVRTIGLETMPRTVENIQFYSRMGFRPGHLTVTMTGEASRHRVAGTTLRAGRLNRAERAALVTRCGERVQASVPGYDYTREIELTIELGLGDLTVVERDGAPAAFALWHSAPLAEARGGEELRVLKLFAESPDALGRVMVAAEGCAAAARLRRVAVRCQTDDPTAYAMLLERGYRVRWTDLRMTLAGRAEVRPPAGETLFSNWEI
jgi:predicted N-acetyltransferase YhbS